MKIIFVSIFILIDIQLVITSTNDICFKVYEDKDFAGDKLDVCFKSEFDCSNLNNEWDKSVSSINTNRQCVVLFEENDCKGTFVKIYPVAKDQHNHHDLETYNFDNKASSISLCGYLNQKLVVWYSINRIDFVGSSGFHETSDEIQCKERCLNDRKCKFIVVSSDGKDCWGKYDGDYVVGNNHERSVISYNDRKFIRTPGESYYGNNIGMIDNINENQCEVICRIHPKCTAANFLQNEKKCFIKNMDQIFIHNDPNIIGIREEDWNCIRLDWCLINSNLDKLCFIQACIQNSSWINWQIKSNDCHFSNSFSF
jgi:hypothetical protein